MKDFEVNGDTKVTLFTKSCYGCDRRNVFGPLREFLNDRKVGIYGGKGAFIVKRIELDPDWQEELKNLGMEAPAVLFENPKGEKLTLTYAEFTERLNEEKESAEPSSNAGSRAGIESPVAPSRPKKRRNSGNRKTTARAKAEAKGKGGGQVEGEAKAKG